MGKREDNDNRVIVLAEEYLERLKARRYSPNSVETYGRAIRDFAEHIGKRDARAVTGRDLEQYRSGLLDRKFKAASIAVYFRAVKLLFRHLEENQIIFDNPAAGLPAMRKPSLLQPVPTEEEMQILLHRPNTATATGMRNRALLETLYSTGLRRQEALDLKVSSLNLQEGRVRVMGKGQRERVVPVGNEALQWLEKYLADVRPAWAHSKSGDALWIGFRGQPLGYEALEQILKLYRSAPGITTRIGLHSIRRACATHMLRRGASPVAIQALLGHSALKHLSQYLKVTVTDLKQAHGESRVGQ